jgi:oligosaccharide repeat unit polymerase
MQGKSIIIFSLICCLLLTLIVGNKSIFLPIIVIFPILITLLKGIYDKKEVFSPHIFFTFFYLLWMGGGFLINFYEYAFYDPTSYSQIAFFILLAFFCWTIGLYSPKLKFSLPAIRFKEKSVTAPGNRVYKRIIGLSIFIIIIGFIFSIYFYYHSFKILLSGPVEATRYIMTFNQGYIVWIGNSLSITVPLYISIKWYFGKKLNIIDYLIIIVPLILMSISLNRAPILWYIIMILIAYHYLKKNIPLKNLTIYAIILFLLSIVIVSIRSPGVSFTERISNEIRVHVLNLSLFFKNFEKIGKLNYRSFILNLSMLLPGHQPDFGLWLKERLGLTFLGGGISVTLIGEGLMNDRIIGVMIESFLIGYIVKLAYGKFRQCFSLRNLFIYVILVCRAASAINYGLSKELIGTLYGIALVMIIIPKHINPEKHI